VKRRAVRHASRSVHARVGSIAIVHDADAREVGEGRLNPVEQPTNSTAGSHGQVGPRRATSAQRPRRSGQPRPASQLIEQRKQPMPSHSPTPRLASVAACACLVTVIAAATGSTWTQDASASSTLQQAKVRALADIEQSVIGESPFEPEITPENVAPSVTMCSRGETTISCFGVATWPYEHPTSLDFSNGWLTCHFVVTLTPDLRKVPHDGALTSCSFVDAAAAFSHSLAIGYTTQYAAWYSKQVAQQGPYAPTRPGAVSDVSCKRRLNDGHGGGFDAGWNCEYAFVYPPAALSVHPSGVMVPSTCVQDITFSFRDITFTLRGDLTNDWLVHVRQDQATCLNGWFGGSRGVAHFAHDTSDFLLEKKGAGPISAPNFP
jgi:hypothetical protein